MPLKWKNRVAFNKSKPGKMITPNQINSRSETAEQMNRS